MCKCTPEIKEPFCGKPGCEWPAENATGAGAAGSASGLAGAVAAEPTPAITLPPPEADLQDMWPPEDPGTFMSQAIAESDVGTPQDEKPTTTHTTYQRRNAERAAREYHRRYDTEFAAGHIAGQMKRQEMIESLIASHLAQKRVTTLDEEANHELLTIQKKIKDYGEEMFQLRPVQ